MQSQGAITADEVESFESMLEGWRKGVTLEKLDMVERLADSKIENARRSFGDDAAAYYFRTDEGKLPSLGVSDVMGGASNKGYSVEPR